MLPAPAVLRRERSRRRVVGIDHLVLRVKDFERSRTFYDAVLGCLGFKRKYSFDDTAGWSNGKTLFWIGEADAEGKKHPHRIGNIGFHHYAFELSRRKDVDDLYEVLKKNKVTVVDPPADYPDYGEGYYAVFFLDPDGMKLEGMVFEPPKKKPAKKKAPAKKATAKKRRG
jgi:catechol 2,3-dioxygenase-like lactoylglutathione lyase family enzyme